MISLAWLFLLLRINLNRVKRTLDIIISLIILALTLPTIFIGLLAVYLSDLRDPVYRAERVGRNEKSFTMYKIRSMIVGADQNGIVSTSNKDSRITRIGSILRKLKLDELLQFINVLQGNMSLVGPRPNVCSEVELYTEDEKKILTVKPGITDLSSIVFSDLNDILSTSQNANLDYNQLVCPWKGRLGLLYVEKNGLFLDIQILLLTSLNIFNRRLALRLLNKVIYSLSNDDHLTVVSKRNKPLTPFPPPGATEVVSVR